MHRHARLKACTYPPTFTPKHTQTLTHTSIYTHRHTNTDRHRHTDTQTYTHTHTHARTHARTHAHTHTHVLPISEDSVVVAEVTGDVTPVVVLPVIAVVAELVLRDR